MTAPDRNSHAITRSLRVHGPVTCSLVKGKPRPSEGLLVESSAAALGMIFDLDTDHPHTCTVSGAVALNLRHSLAGRIDDVAHSFGGGQTYASTAGCALSRIPVQAQQDQR